MEGVLGGQIVVERVGKIFQDQRREVINCSVEKFQDFLSFQMTQTSPSLTNVADS